MTANQHCLGLILISNAETKNTDTSAPSKAARLSGVLVPLTTLQTFCNYQMIRQYWPIRNEVDPGNQSLLGFVTCITESNDWTGNNNKYKEYSSAPTDISEFDYISPSTQCFFI